jgi:hypothetical protein
MGQWQFSFVVSGRRRDAAWWRRAGALIVTALLVSGCTAPRGPLVVTDPDPSVKIPAIKNAARKGDKGAVRQMVADLNSDDPAVRFYAISGLQRITGERFGYDYFADETQRKPALQRWRDWLDRREGRKASGSEKRP